MDAKEKLQAIRKVYGTIKREFCYECCDDCDTCNDIGKLREDVVKLEGKFLNDFREEIKKSIDIL